MIKGILIHNFKSIQTAMIDLAKINFFIGENNVGKSTILHSLAFLSQSLKKKPEYTGIVDLNSFNETIFKKDVNNKMVFDIKQSINLKLPMRDEELQDLIKQVIWSLTITKEGVKEQSIKSEHGPVFFSFNNGELTFPLLEKIDSRHSQQRSGSSLRGGGAEVLDINYRMSGTEDGKGEVLSPASVIIQKILENLSNTLQNIYFLPITRGILQWEYSIDVAMPNRIIANDNGVSATNILYFLNQSQYNRDRKYISEWAAKFGISLLSAVPRELTESRKKHYISQVQTKPFCGLESYDDELDIYIEVVAKGFGSRQVLPIIVQSALAPPGSIILVEEPEIHLHPKSQGDLVEFFVDRIKKDRQFLVTTHSEHMIARVQTLIASGKLSCKDVHVFEVRKGSQGTEIQQIEIAKDGGMELPTFFNVNKEEMERFLEALKNKTG